MRCLLQRVSHANVVVAGDTTGRIGAGLLVFAGIETADTPEIISQMAHKILHYRIFSDASGKMNQNVQDVAGDILLVSQFTLAANTQKGLRPGFSTAARPELSKPLYEKMVDDITAFYKAPQTGIFGADMQVSLCNDGPVSFVLHL